VTGQRGLIAFAVAAGLLAGGLYWAGAQRVTVLVAAEDLTAAHALTLADVATREIPPDAIPAGALTDPASAAGRFARGPIWKGQLLLADALGDGPAAFDGGVTVPTGYRAVAVPVDAAHALGGAVVPGSRVDVIAVPAPGRGQPDRVTELLAAAALVIDIRGEQGGAFERHPASSRAGTAVRERIGSVIVAVGPATELRVADRMASSTFVLALVPDRP
jgi:pilus assembly protein CpaB